MRAHAIAASIVLLWTATTGAQSDADVPSLRVGAATGVRVDGVLDDPAWAAADRIPNPTMIEPSQGGTPTGRTRVGVVASRDALYIGVICDDPDPTGIVSFTK